MIYRGCKYDAAEPVTDRSGLNPRLIDLMSEELVTDSIFGFVGNRVHVFTYIYSLFYFVELTNLFFWRPYIMTSFMIQIVEK